MFQETVKTQQKQHKLHRDQLTSKTPKLEQKEALKKMKEEQTRQLAMLAQQYENTIAEMVEHQNVRIKILHDTDIFQARMREHTPKLHVSWHILNIIC